MNRVSIALLCLMVCLGRLENSDAREYRNILSASYTDYEGMGLSRTWENTLIAPIHSGVSGVARIYRDDRGAWDNTILSAGAVVALSRFNYLEAVYGYGEDSGNRRADSFLLELTREKPGYVLGLGYRHSIYPDFSVNVVSPSARWIFSPRVELFGKYFGSIDSKSHFDQACWVEGKYYPRKKLGISAGITAGNRIYTPEYESKPGLDMGNRFFSWLVRGSYDFTAKAALRYQYERLTRDSTYTDIKNSLILDIRF